MILIDTNVISEPLRAKPDPHVVEWLDSQSLETLYLSVITVAELRFGIALLPVGKRRNQLSEQLETQVMQKFAGRILSFDLSATQAFADLMAKAQASGTIIGMADGYIASIARVNGMKVATRDTSPFEAAGIGVINPWID